MEKCETSCTSECDCADSRECCPTETAGCPVEAFAELSQCASKQALKEVYVDILKAKIQKAWGARLDKAADIILEAKGAAWEAALARAKAKSEVTEKLSDLFSKR